MEELPENPDELVSEEKFETEWLPFKGKIVGILPQSCDSHDVGIITDINRSCLTLKCKSYTINMHLSDVLAIGPATQKEFEEEDWEW